MVAEAKESVRSMLQLPWRVGQDVGCRDGGGAMVVRGPAIAPDDLMNWPYIHTLINHFPIILTVVGCGVLAAALATGNRGIWLYALVTLTFAGLSVYPADFTGDQASHALRNTWYVVRSMVREHDDSATWALATIIPMGAAAAYGWWRMLKREVTGLPPMWLRVVVSLLAALGLAVITRTAVLGGRIVHESPRLTSPPVGAAAAPNAPATPR